MNNNIRVAASQGMGVLGWTFIVFLVLKLIDKIDWSWWWVTAPIWGPVALALGIMAVAGLLWAICTFCLWIIGKRSVSKKKVAEMQRKAILDNLLRRKK